MDKFKPALLVSALPSGATSLMKISVLVHTHNTYGGNPSISLTGQFLELGCPGFGTAIQELEIHVYFRSSRFRAQIDSQYHQFLESLPDSKFHRKKNRFELSFVSALGDATIVSGCGPAELDLFIGSAKEIMTALPGIKAKLKKGDNFDFAGVMIFIAEKMKHLPQTEAEFAQLQRDVEAERKRKLASLNEWDKLGVDWADFHPQARAILDTPFFWDCTNDFSPNGNDTGADVLDFYQAWRRRNRNGDAMKFFTRLMKEWEVTMPPPDDDPFSRETYAEAIIGLAFAQLKIEGACESEVVHLALAALKESCQRMQAFHSDWILLPEKLSTLAIMESKLKTT
jgi:uncharacterized protein YfeS